jgi:hypothetical protein
MAEYAGIPITVDALPNEAKDPVAPGITEAAFRMRLKAGGTVTLNGTELVLGPIDYGRNSLAFLAVDRLELRDGARIVTNGNSLVIFANT